MNNSLEVKNVILHDIYRSFNQGLNYILNFYVKNDYYELKKLLLKCDLDKNINNNISNNKNVILLTSILTLILLGND